MNFFLDDFHGILIPSQYQTAPWNHSVGVEPPYDWDFDHGRWDELYRFTINIHINNSSKLTHPVVYYYYYYQHPLYIIVLCTIIVLTMIPIVVGQNSTIIYSGMVYYGLLWPTTMPINQAVFHGTELWSNGSTVSFGVSEFLWDFKQHQCGQPGNPAINLPYHDWEGFIHMAVCQNLVPLVNIKIAGKWMFIPLKMVLIGIDPYPYQL